MVVVGSKKTLTAHASAAGVALITHDYIDGVQAVELVCLHGKKTSEVVWPEDFFKALDKARLEEVDEQLEDKSNYQELMELSKFASFGTSSNFSELAAERISYNIRASEVPFVPERVNVSFSKDGKPTSTVILPGELKGFNEEVSTTVNAGDTLEPLTAQEALDFVIKVFSYHEVTYEDIKHQPAIDLWLKVEFSRAIGTVEDIMTSMRERKEDTATLLAYLEVSNEEWRRAKATLANDNIGGNWCYTSENNIGDRDGTIEDQSRQNDRNYTKQDQCHLPGERIDGRLPLSEELELAAEKNMSIVWSMYYKEGEVKNPKALDNLMHVQGLSRDDAMVQMRAMGELAKEGENKGWSERSVYFMRCASTRNEVFADKLWHILTWPLNIVESCMDSLRANYKRSVFENREGPKREKINGRWSSAPLKGAAAIKHLKSTGLGTLKGKRVNKNVTVFVGASWHKLLLNKKHMDALEEAFQWRQGKIKLNIGGEIVEEEFEQTIASLPQKYVLGAYSNG